MNSPWRKNLLPPCLCLLLLAGPLAVQAGWQLVWNDEFAQADGTAPDASKWGYEVGGGGFGNNELEYYTARTNNARIVGGQLVIEARSESYGGRNYTSARLLTKGKWSWTFGRMEARIKIPRGQGIWPAFWMLGTNIDSVSWPACGEIDIMENIGKTNELGKVYGTAHGPQSGADYNGGSGVGGNYVLPGGAAYADDFHVFAVEWTTNQIMWYVDNHPYFTATPDSLPAGGTWPFSQPQFILLNLAVGGNWPGNPDGTTVFPQQLLVDYVRVYRYVPTAPAAPGGVSASPGSGQVYLSWDASTSGATGYRIKRAPVSGGTYTVVGSTATNTFTDAGLADCSNYYYVVTATNLIGESTNSSESAATLGAFSIAVNSGGSAAGQFVPDAFFSGGTQASPATAAIDTSGLVAPAPAAVYQTERYGNCTYTFAGLVTGVKYHVRLHLSENYWTATGQRSFNVFINAAQVLTNFDILAATGAQNKATIQEFTAIPTNGTLVIRYVTVTDNAKSGGIEIQLARPMPPAGLSTSSGNRLIALKWNAVTGASYTVKKATAATGPFFPVFAGLAGTNCTDTTVTNGVTCFYVVSASVLGCESTNSLAASATPINPLASVSVQAVSGNLVLTWPAGTLQSATNIAGIWSDVDGAKPPHTNPMGLQQEFFRLRLQ